MDILLGQYKGLKATIPFISYTEDDVNSQIASLLAGNPARVENCLLYTSPSPRDCS